MKQDYILYGKYDDTLGRHSLSVILYTSLV